MNSCSRCSEGLTPKLAARYAKAGPRTLQRDLNRLRDVGLVVRRRRGWRSNDLIISAFLSPDGRERRVVDVSRLLNPSGRVVEIQATGAVEGSFGGAGGSPVGQERVLVTIAAGTIFRPGPSQLFVNGRNQMRRVEAMAAQVAAVANVLGDEGPGGAVLPRPVLCMVDSEWGLFTKPFVVQGVTVTHPRGLQKQLATPGPLTPAAIKAIAQLLQASFRSA